MRSSYNGEDEEELSSLAAAVAAAASTRSVGGSPSTTRTTSVLTAQVPRELYRDVRREGWPLELRAAITVIVAGCATMAILLVQWISPAARLASCMVLGGTATFGTLYVRRVRSIGFLSYLPAGMRRLLLDVRPIDILTHRAGFTQSVEELAPFLIHLEEDEVEETLRRMRPESALRLTQPGLIHVLPRALRAAILPPAVDANALPVVEELLDEEGRAVSPVSMALLELLPSPGLELGGDAAMLEGGPDCGGGSGGSCGGGGRSAPRTPPHGSASGLARRDDAARRSSPQQRSPSSAESRTVRRLRAASFDGSLDAVAPSSPYERGMQHLSRAKSLARELFSKRIQKMLGGRIGKILQSPELMTSVRSSLSGWTLWGIGIASVATISAQLRYSQNARKVLQGIVRKLMLQISLLGLIATGAGFAIRRKLHLAIKDREKERAAIKSERAARGGAAAAELTPAAAEGGGAGGRLLPPPRLQHAASKPTQSSGGAQ